MRLYDTVLSLATIVGAASFSPSSARANFDVSTISSTKDTIAWAPRVRGGAARNRSPSRDPCGDDRLTVLSSEKTAHQARGGYLHTNGKRAWETAVRRGRGGFPSPSSWDPMDEGTLRVKAEALLAPEVPDPVIEQFEPTRVILWRKWRGTILEETWRSTLTNMGMALLVCLGCRRLEVSYPNLNPQLLKVDVIWKIHMTLTTFILTFFINQAYALWRTVYETTRALQGRLQDMHMLTTTHLLRQQQQPSACFSEGDRAARDIDGVMRHHGGPRDIGDMPPAHTGATGEHADASSAVGSDGTGTSNGAPPWTGFDADSNGDKGICGEDVVGRVGSRIGSSDYDGDDGVRLGESNITVLSDSLEWLSQFVRYTRLWHVMFYASCSRKHACFCTDSGLTRLHLCGLITEDELPLLTSLPGPPAHRHLAAFQWMVAFFLKGTREKRFCEITPLTTRMMEQFVTLRAKSGSISDSVGGRTKLAYAHAVQLLVDVFLLLTPFALFSEVGFWSIAATGVLTTFYQGLFNLSKTFIDPLDNEDATVDSDCIVIDSLIKESSNGAARWTQAALRFPF